MIYDTCSQCQFFRAVPGWERKGECYGHPPTKTYNGFNSGVPEVAMKRPACSLFKPLSGGEGPAVKTKIHPDTLGLAAKARRQERVTA